MNETQVFKNEMFGELPLLIIEGAEYFGATESARSLSFSNPHKAIDNHVDVDDCTTYTVIDSLGRKQKKKFINESGLYSLIFGASKQGKNKRVREKAKKFKRWVTSEVLPSIRKHGMYATDELLNNPDLLIGVATKLKEEKEKRILAENTIQQLKPKALFSDAVQGSANSCLVKDLSVLLKQNGIDVGQNRLFSYLREKGYLGKGKGHYNKPTQRSLDVGLFEYKEHVHSSSDGTILTKFTPKVTGKGQQYFINKFLFDEDDTFKMVERRA